MTAPAVPPPGRVTAVRVVLKVGRDAITVGWLPSEGWFADCPCRRRRCSHIEHVLATITDDQGGGEAMTTNHASACPSCGRLTEPYDNEPWPEAGEWTSAHECAACGAVWTVPWEQPARIPTDPNGDRP